MSINEIEVLRFLDNPANRLLINLNTVKRRYKNIFKDMETMKNINYNKALNIVIKHEYSKACKMYDTNTAVLSLQGLADDLLSIYKWKKWKKIYTFDEELMTALTIQADNTKADDLVIPMEFLENLPYNSFFINVKGFIDDAMEECGDDLRFNSQFEKLYNDHLDYAEENNKGIFKPYRMKLDGFFVSIDTEPGTDKKVLSFNVPIITYYYIDNGGDITNINSYELGPVTSYSYEIRLDGETIGDGIRLVMEHRVHSDILQENLNEKVTIRCLTYLLYIMSAKSDIIDASISTYKPKKKKESIVDTISEVQRFNVGYRVGAVLKNYSVHIQSECNTTGVHKIPHIRRGHWHHYWTGPRNSNERQLIVHWIPPIAINSNWEDENPIIDISPLTI